MMLLKANYIRQSRWKDSSKRAGKKKENIIHFLYSSIPEPFQSTNKVDNLIMGGLRLADIIWKININMGQFFICSLQLFENYLSMPLNGNQHTPYISPMFLNQLPNTLFQGNRWYLQLIATYHCQNIWGWKKNL